MSGTPQGERATERLLKILSALRSARALPVNLTGAALAGDVASMQAFIDRGADIEERTAGFASPLCAACSAGSIEAVRFLLDRGASPSPRNAIVTPLHAAVSNDHREVFALLVARGAPIEGAADGFLMACGKGLGRIVRNVVDAGFDLGATRNGKTFRELGIDAARATGPQSSVEAYLRSKPVSDRQLDEEEASRRAERGSLAAGLARVRGEEPVAKESERTSLVDEALDLIRHADDSIAEWTDRDGESALGLAARTGVLPIVQAFLDRGADPRHRSPMTGFTPVYRAAEGGHRDVVRLLLDKGADPNTVASGRVSPLMMAAQAGDREMVAALLAAGASAAAKDVNGRSPTRYASGPFANEIVTMLSPPSSRRRKAATPGGRAPSIKEPTKP